VTASKIVNGCLLEAHCGAFDAGGDGNATECMMPEIPWSSQREA
jgi:hypothetical protein